MPGIRVAAVSGRSEKQAFIALPWEIYRGDSHWVPPIKSAQALLLDPERHPFWAFSQGELFLARRGDDVVGRIAALVDGNYNRYHDEQAAAWGFFECRRDPEAAAALFAAAQTWARERGMRFLRGPLNPSTNYEVGLLVQGFDSPPTLMMTYNPPYYAELAAGCGLRKEKDLLAYRIARDFDMPAWAVSMARALTEKGEFHVRRCDVRRLQEELALMNRVYRECWGKNWGFVPMTDDEIRASARDLVHILDPDLAFFLHYRDQPVGVALLLPDINPLLKRFNGTLGLSALIKQYLFASEVKGLRGLLLGVREEYRQLGAPLVAFAQVLEAVRAKPQYQYVELGWNLEDNEGINRLYEDDGGLKPAKRYRIYRKDL